MYKNFIRITGKKSGPTSIILAGVHGDEKCGIEAFKNILPSLKIERGTVLFGFGNPRAIEKNKRFTESNLNRMFKSADLLSNKEKNSYEYGRAQLLKKYLKQADTLLDIHASFTPNSKPFIICEANAEKIVKYLPITSIVSGFDQIQPGGTDYFMNSIGKIGICIECGYLGDQKTTKMAKKNIIAFLKACGHISNDLQPKKQTYIRMYDLYKTRSKKFFLSKPFSDFERVLKGQLIGIDGKNEVRADKNSLILFARNRTRIGDESFLLGEKKNSLA